jgi:hypothetical protein
MLIIHPTNTRNYSTEAFSTHNPQAPAPVRTATRPPPWPQSPPHE